MKFSIVTPVLNEFPRNIFICGPYSDDCGLHIPQEGMSDLDVGLIRKRN